MMNFTNPNAKKALKGHKKTFVVGLCFLLAGLALIIFTLVMAKSKLDNPKSFSEITHRGGNSDEVATLEVTFVFDAFASRENSKKENYCFATDGDDYFMLRVTEKELEELQGKIADEGKITIYGVTKKISDKQLISTACNFLNAKRFFKSNIGSSNIKGYIGAFYLDYTKPNMFSVMLARTDFLPLFGLVFIVIGAIVCLAGFANLKKFKKLAGTTGNEIERLDAEMNSPNAIWFDDLKIYATTNHIIALGKGINAIKYEDILWFYMIQHMTNGIKDYRMLNVLDRSGDEKTIANVSNKKKIEESSARQITALEQKIWENNQEAIIGYSPEIATQMRAKAAELKRAAKAAKM